MFAISPFLHAYSYSASDWTVVKARSDGGRLGLGVLVGLATTLVMSVVLVPGDRAPARLTGYAGAALTLGCLLRLDTSTETSYVDDHGNVNGVVDIHLGLWVFYLTAALTVATYIYCDIRIQRGDAHS
ncbi:hypothetical protein [Embleya sp. NBC_00896]|uniref:hypothetical protein n=1 Tax=Embleya sp. NBC_00896 TaxID=2975961 RepID=UPI002F90D51F|nr:hypothetical protein OG928_47300 [Embleya sp. NBC_00896]